GGVRIAAGARLDGWVSAERAGDFAEAEDLSALSALSVAALSVVPGTSLGGGSLGRVVLGAASAATAAMGCGAGAGGGGGWLVDDPLWVSAKATVPPMMANTPITAMRPSRRFGRSS